MVLKGCVLVLKGCDDHERWVEIERGWRLRGGGD